MAILNREQLYNKVSEAISHSGWSITSNTDIKQFPVRLELLNLDQTRILRIYIWNLTHGGGERDASEYRIQVKVDRFEEESNSKTLILGYWDEQEVFCGFDISKHIGKPGWSSSMQVKKESLLEAKIKGISSYTKSNGEITICFTAANFMKYASNPDELHLTGNISQYIEENPIGPKEPISDDSEEETIPFRYAISSYGADYPADMIIKRIENNIIYIPPFQRRFVWNLKEASRFIESLILGLPVPGVFLSKENETGKLLIVDGQQRLLSLFSFYTNNFKGRPFKLSGVQQDLDGKGYDDLEPNDRFRLDESIIHATIIKQDEPDDDESSIYLIFERLNSGGRLLSSQEIRACVYYGEFNEYLDKTVLQTDWRSIFGQINDRLKEQEVLLRFIALYYAIQEYKKPLKSFLNHFMQSNRNLQIFNSNQLDDLIKPTIAFVNQNLGKNAFRLGSGVNAAIFDSVMIGLCKRMMQGQIKDTHKFIKNYEELMVDQTYLSAVRTSTSDEQVVKKRIDLATDKFKDLI